MERSNVTAVVFRAAKDSTVEYAEMTPETKFADTAIELPPLVEYPHVITLPLVFNAAKAPLLE